MTFAIVPHLAGEYVVLNNIDFDRAERNICLDCVDKLWGGGKSETLKQVGYSTVSKTYESEEYEEGVDWDSAWGWW